MTLSPKRRRLRRVLTALGICALLPFAAYLEEDWRGARAWEACRRELEAKGERLDFADFIPPRIPDERNLAMIPFFAQTLGYRPDPVSGLTTFGPFAAQSNHLPNMPEGLLRPPNAGLTGPDSGRHIDLALYQSFFAQSPGYKHPDQPGAPDDDVLVALEPMDAPLDEVARAAAERSLTRFPVKWEVAQPAWIYQPHLNIVQQLVQVLALRATARLANGQPEEAMRDVQLCLRLSRDAGADHLLISYLVEITCLRIALTPVWEGLADRRWARAQLESLQRELGGFDPLNGLSQALRVERGFVLKEIEYLKRQPDRVQAMKLMMLTVAEAPKPSWTDNVYKFVPDGCFDLNKAAAAHFVQYRLLAAIDAGRHRVSAERLKIAQADDKREKFGPIQFVSDSSPIYYALVQKGARIQAMLDEAVTACALERFWAERQEYPAHLEELSPGYLERVPEDVAQVGPLHYSLTGDGRYQLYGVGWNGRDDGGQVAWLNSRQLDRDQGDWVWQYTGVQPPPPAEK